MSDAALVLPSSSGTSMAAAPIDVQVREHLDDEAAARWNAFLRGRPDARVAHRAEWAAIFREALQHRPFYLEASRAGDLVGVMPLTLVQSFLFGKFLVSSPYVNV